MGREKRNIVGFCLGEHGLHFDTPVSKRELEAIRKQFAPWEGHRIAYVERGEGELRLTIPTRGYKEVVIDMTGGDHE